MKARYEKEDDSPVQSIYSSKHVAMPLARFGEVHIYRKVALAFVDYDFSVQDLY